MTLYFIKQATKTEAYVRIKEIIITIISYSILYSSILVIKYQSSLIFHT